MSRKFQESTAAPKLPLAGESRDDQKSPKILRARLGHNALSTIPGSSD
jgi:hypothetical protein